MSEVFFDGRVILHCGDCLDVMATIPDNSIDAMPCDPPYGLGFMGRAWDHGVPGVQYWREALRILKPGGHLLASSGTRTYHRLASAIEDAGFEIRDMVAWMYGTGFPKSLDVSKAIDEHFFIEWLRSDDVRAVAYADEVKACRRIEDRDAQRQAVEKVESFWRELGGFSRRVVGEGETVKRMIPGAEQHKNGWEKNDGAVTTLQITEGATADAREWSGWGTGLKPGIEPFCLARKPLSEGTVAANVLRWRTGALNINASRIPGESTKRVNTAEMGYHGGNLADEYQTGSDLGRWPANVVHDGSDEVIAAFPANAGALAPVHKRNGDKTRNTYGSFKGDVDEAGSTFRGDSGSAARFFFSSKATKEDRAGSKHPTVKPVSLMEWSCALITPTGGTVLDPFAGTGTTGEAAYRGGFKSILIEKDTTSQDDIRRRMRMMAASPSARKVEMARAESQPEKIDHGPLFATMGDATDV